jgi:Holliday junction resolvasome RuvABC endonuclease subunit
MKIPISKRFIVAGIDQSLTGTGVAVLVVEYPGLTVMEQTTIKSELKGYARLEEILLQIKDLVTNSAHAGQYGADLVAVEDYTRMASSASLCALIELCACIKLDLTRLGLYPEIQNQSSMKKFAFGYGGTQKDSSYLLKVFDATGLRFVDDNAADAYLHAWMLAERVWALRGEKLLSMFNTPQREVLMAGPKKEFNLSDAKLKKLGEVEQLKLLCQYHGVPFPAQPGGTFSAELHGDDCLLDPVVADKQP